MQQISFACLLSFLGWTGLIHNLTLTLLDRRYVKTTLCSKIRCPRAGPTSDTHDSVGLMGHVALTPVSLDDHTDHHKDLLLPPQQQQQFSSSNREFVSMSNIVSDNHNDNLEVVEFIDVPTDIDMTGLDIDPEEIYQNLEEAANH